MYRAVTDRVIIKLDDMATAVSLLGFEPKYQCAGVVLSVGEQVKDIKVGDKIIFHQFDELSLPEKNLAVVREKSVLGVLS